MPDLFHGEDDIGASDTDATMDGASQDTKASKRKATPRADAPRRRAKPELKYAGALTSALAKSLENAPVKPTKDQLAAEVIPDVIAAMEAFPGVKPSKLWPILKELGAENDGATFKRAVVRLLHKEAEHLPVIRLSLQTRSARVRDTNEQAEGSAGAERHRDASAKDAEPALPDAKPVTEQELRNLRAPGF